MCLRERDIVIKVFILNISKVVNKYAFGSSTYIVDSCDM